MKMADLEMEIKNEGETKRHKTQGKSRVCEEKPSHKHDVDVIAMMALKKCPRCLNLDCCVNPNAS